MRGGYADKRLPDDKGKLVHQRSKAKGFSASAARGANTNTVHYYGIAADERERIARHTKSGVLLPLVELGWEEDDCGLWCKYAGLLSPIYTTATRGGCWFCHNQGIDQMRKLRQMYPDLWKLLMKWDSDSPVSFKSDGHTVHDFDRRFALEDAGILLPGDKTFKWSMLDGDIQMKMF